MFQGFANAGIGGLLGGFAAGAITLAVSKNKVVVLKDASPEDTAAALEALKKEARVPDYK